MNDDNERLRGDLARADAACITARDALRDMRHERNEAKNILLALFGDDEIDKMLARGPEVARYAAAEIVRLRAAQSGTVAEQLRAEAGDSTADETSAQVEFDVGGKTYVGKAMPRREGENAPSWTTVDTGGPLGIFLVPNCDLRPASSVRDTAETAGGQS
jgi:hypothetical protein